MTRLLSLIVRLGAAHGERMLMTAHSHMAINIALNKICAQGIQVVKVESATQRKGLDATSGLKSTSMFSSTGRNSSRPHGSRRPGSRRR